MSRSPKEDSMTVNVNLDTGYETPAFDAPTQQPDAHIGKLVGINYTRLEDGRARMTLVLQSDATGAEHYYDCYLPAEWDRDPLAPPEQVRNYLTPEEQALGRKETPHQAIGRHIANKAGTATLQIVKAAAMAIGRVPPQGRPTSGEEYVRGYAEAFIGAPLLWTRRPGRDGRLRVSAIYNAADLANQERLLKSLRKRYKFAWEG
jgi:hypothetical protein